MATKTTNTETTETVEEFPKLLECSKSGENTYTYKLAVAEDLTIENTFSWGAAMEVRSHMAQVKSTKDETKGAIMMFFFSVIFGDDNTFAIVDHFSDEDTSSVYSKMDHYMELVITETVGKDKRN